MNRDILIRIMLGLACLAVTVLMIVLIIKDEKAPKPADRVRGKMPANIEGTMPELQVIGKYDTRFGNLYVYKLDTDTIYVSEGHNQSSPISIEVK
jgi:hypothetical protein